MRLRVVVPRRRRRGGLGGLTAVRWGRAGLAAAAAVALLTGCGGGDSGTPARTAAAPPALPSGLAVGLTEANASLLWAPGARAVPEPFARWGRQVAALRPRYLRLIVDWGGVQPDASRPPDWDLPASGCLRDREPCAPFAGVRDQLRAIRSQQRGRAGGGFEVVVVMLGTPGWAAEAPHGCEQRRTTDRARAPRRAALPAYRRLVTSLVEAARGEGVALPWWSAWNEPNHPSLLSPQRTRCSAGAPPLAPATYTRLVRALRAALGAAPGVQRLVLGDLAGLPRPRPLGTGIAEFVRALPRDVACASPVWAQHAYVGGEDVVEDLLEAVDGRGCPSPARVWITETGVGAAHAGSPRDTDTRSLRAGCRRMHATLGRWYEDPRVDAAFQYTFREDDAFPVGLVDTGLRRAYAPLRAWLAWGGDRRPEAPAPPLPAACSAPD